MSDNDDERDETTDSGETDAPETAKSDETANDESSESTSSESSASASEAGASEAGASGDAGKRMSAGARLAAAKAAKAVVKAAKKEERKAAAAASQPQPEPEADPDAAVEAQPEDPVAQLNESEIGRAALRAGRWWENNQQMGWIAVGAAALAIAGFLGWQYHKDSTSAAAGVLLEDAVELASARVVAADAEEPADDEEGDAEPEQTFPTRTARDEAALEAYQAVIAQYPDQPAAGIARLGAARALLALGRHDEAQEMYQAAFDRNGGRSGTIAWQALEGVGFAQEAAGHPDDARGTYERLANLDNHAYEQVANYHLARLMLARGERDEARTALRELVDALRADTVEDSSEPRFPYLLSQAEVRLRELDPSSAASAGPSLLGGPGGAGGGGGEGEQQIDPEQLQELIRQFQARQQQQGGGAGEGGEGGGE